MNNLITLMRQVPTTCDVKVASDSGVYVSDDEQGYERIAILTNWNPDDRSLMARAWVHVDRFPLKSHAVIEVWTGEGWNRINSLNPTYWWGNCPGYTRTGKASEAATDGIILQLVDALIPLAKAGSI